jgi:hypothetical protein
MSLAQPNAKPSMSIKTMAITGYAARFNRIRLAPIDKPFELLGFSASRPGYDRGRATATLLAGRLEHALDPAAVGFDA